MEQSILCTVHARVPVAVQDTVNTCNTHTCTRPSTVLVPILGTTVLFYSTCASVMTSSHTRITVPDTLSESSLQNLKYCRAQSSKKSCNVVPDTVLTDSVRNSPHCRTVAVSDSLCRIVTVPGPHCSTVTVSNPPCITVTAHCIINTVPDTVLTAGLQQRQGLTVVL